MPACCSYLCHRLLTTFHIPAHDYDTDAQLSQLAGYGPANSARPSCNKCAGSHLIKSFFISICMPKRQQDCIPSVRVRTALRYRLSSHKIATGRISPGPFVNLRSRNL